MGDLVLQRRQGDLAILTLNRAERHNSLVPGLLQALLDAFHQVGDEPAARAVVLRADGRSFSTGGDLRGFAEHEDALAAYADGLVGLLNRVILAMLTLPAPIVVAVDGQVTGGSLGLVLAGDLVLVTPNARFTPYYAVVGFSPDGGWTALLPDIIGPRRAANLLYRNHTIMADQALEWGIANAMVPAGRIDAATLAAARDIAAKRPGSIGHAKQLLRPDPAVIAARLDQERVHFVAQVQTAEARQGIRDFLERRPSRAGQRVAA